MVDPEGSGLMGASSSSRPGTQATPVPPGTNAPVTSAYWMPFTDRKVFDRHPKLVASASGVHFRTADGRTILDGTSGLWCVNAGHCQPRIVEAIREQAAILDYASCFQMGHPRAFELADRLAALFPGNLNRVFFANSGSEAVDTALKVAFAFHHARGEPGRNRLVGRERAYHGVGFGGLSVGGIASNRRCFPLLPYADHLPHTHDPARSAFTRGQPRSGNEAADALASIIALHGADSIAAVVVEPVAGSTGVLVPPQGYLQRLREITARHGILLIFDEVITAFGRLGAASAAERFGVTPDILVCAKGMTNGAVPMGATVMREDIHETILEATGTGIELFHGYTCSGHPLAAVAGLAALDVYLGDGLFARARELEGHFEDAVHDLKDCPNVVDIRNIGLAAAIELAPRRSAPGKRAMEVFSAAFEAGLLVRTTGDTIALAPPLIVEKEHIDEIVGRLRRILEEVA